MNLLKDQNFQNKENQQNSHSSQYRIKINRVILSCPRERTNQSDSYSQVTTSRRTTILSQSRNHSFWQKNQQFHQKRRQNQLNSMFRIRKQKLQAITKYNKEFYVRLNSQQSHYARRLQSKQKDSNQKDQFTFKNLDSKQSRQMLGPICNFGSLFNVNKEKKLNSSRLQNLLQQKQNKSKYLKTQRSIKQQSSNKINKKQSQSFSTPLRVKLGFNQQYNPERDQNILTPLTERRPKLQHLSQSIQFNSFLKTPQRLQKLPQIYSFF